MEQILCGETTVLMIKSSLILKIIIFIFEYTLCLIPIHFPPSSKVAIILNFAYFILYFSLLYDYIQ